MNREQLIQALRRQPQTQPMAVIRHARLERVGVAMIVGESLGGPWQSGSLIVFWKNGDHTDIGSNDEIELLFVI